VWAPDATWTIWRREKNASLAEFQTPHSPARSLVTVADYAIPAS